MRQVGPEKFVEIGCKLATVPAVIIDCISASSFENEHAQRCEKQVMAAIIFSLAVVCYPLKCLMKIWEIAAHDFAKFISNHRAFNGLVLPGRIVVFF